MLRSTGTDTATGKPMVLLGLEPANMARLREGQPIKLNLRHLVPEGPPTELPDIDVVIFFAGSDERDALLAAARHSGAEIHLVDE